jgi:outer membrane protein OmpA-like peptidoglycan-associated protein
MTRASRSNTPADKRLQRSILVGDRRTTRGGGAEEAEPEIAGRPAERNGFRTMMTKLRVSLLVVSGMIGLAGCSWVPDAVNPVEWYRDLSGTSKNDDKGEGRNAKNLEAGAQEPYPNLASVPSAPSTAMSGADRSALEKGLVADRTNAKYSDDELRAGHTVLPPATSSAPDPAAASASSGGAAGATDTPVLPPKKTPPGQEAATETHRRAAESPPTESAIITPTVRGVPQGDAPRPPPPAPGLAGNRPQTVVALKPPPLHAPSGAGKRRVVSVDVTEIGFPAGAATLPAGSSDQLAEAVTLFRQNGGKLRIVGYGHPDTGTVTADQELDSFSQAIDRANAVAQELAKLGVPADKIAVEAAPSRGPRAKTGDRAEIFLEY